MVSSARRAVLSSPHKLRAVTTMPQTPLLFVGTSAADPTEAGSPGLEKRNAASPQMLRHARQPCFRRSLTLIHSESSSDSDSERQRQRALAPSMGATRFKELSFQERRAARYRRAASPDDELATDGDGAGAGARAAHARSHSLEAKQCPLQQRCGLLRSKGIAVSVSFSMLAACHDVTGFLARCTSPPDADRESNATSSLRRFRGKVVLTECRPSVPEAALFASAGVSALVVAKSKVEHGITQGAERFCPTETLRCTIPVVFITEGDAKKLEQGSLVRISFDAERKHAPVTAQKTLSKNACHRRQLIDREAEDTANEGNMVSRQIFNLDKISADSSDDDSDEEFGLLRRRRERRASSTRKGPLNSHSGPSCGNRPIADHVTMSEVVSDDSGHESKLFDQAQHQTPSHLGFSGTQAKDLTTRMPVHSQVLDSGGKWGRSGSIGSADARAAVTEMETHLDDVSKRSANLATSAAKDPCMRDLATKLQIAVECQNYQTTLETVLKVHELCWPGCPSQYLQDIIHLTGAVDALWTILKGPPEGSRAPVSSLFLEGQIASAIILRRAAVQQTNVNVLLKAEKSISVLAQVLMHENDERLKQKVAALVANLSFEADNVRARLCSNDDVVAGLCQMLFSQNSQAIDSSLAALSNLSLNQTQTGVIARKLNMERVITILMAGGSKACHRGAGLIRNFLCSTKTRAITALIPGMSKALCNLQASSDGDTRQRAADALHILLAHRKEKDEGMCMIEQKIMDTASVTTSRDCDTPVSAPNMEPFSRFNAPSDLVAGLSLSLQTSTLDQRSPVRPTTHGLAAEKSASLPQKKDDLSNFVLNPPRSTLMKKGGDTDDDEAPEETLRILDDEVLDLLQEEEVDDEVLLLLRDVCCGHADNTRRLCFNENALVTILGIAFRVSTNRSRVRAAIAAEILSFCMFDDENWSKVTDARLRVKKEHGERLCGNQKTVASCDKQEWCA